MTKSENIDLRELAEIFEYPIEGEERGGRLGDIPDQLYGYYTDIIRALRNVYRKKQVAPRQHGGPPPLTTDESFLYAHQLDKTNERIPPLRQAHSELYDILNDTEKKLLEKGTRKRERITISNDGIAKAVRWDGQYPWADDYGEKSFKKLDRLVNRHVSVRKWEKLYPSNRRWHYEQKFLAAHYERAREKGLKGKPSTLLKGGKHLEGSTT